MTGRLSQWIRSGLRTSPFTTYGGSKAAASLPLQVTYVHPHIRKRDSVDPLYHYLIASEHCLDLFASTNRVGGWLNIHFEYLLDLAAASFLSFGEWVDPAEPPIPIGPLVECVDAWRKFRLLWDRGMFLDEAFQLFCIKYSPSDLRSVAEGLLAARSGAPLDQAARATLDAKIRQMADRVDRSVQGDSVHSRANHLLHKLVTHVGQDMGAVRAKLYEASAIFVQDIDLFDISYDQLRALTQHEPARYDRDHRFELLASGKDIEVAPIPAYSPAEIANDRPGEDKRFLGYDEWKPARLAKEKFPSTVPCDFLAVLETSRGTIVVPVARQEMTVSLAIARMRLLRLLQLTTMLGVFEQSPLPARLVTSVRQVLKGTEGTTSMPAFETCLSRGRKAAEAFSKLALDTRVVAGLILQHIEPKSRRAKRRVLVPRFDEVLNRYRKLVQEYRDAALQLMHLEKNQTRNSLTAANLAGVVR